MANPLARMSAVGSGLKVLGDAAKRALLFKNQELLKRTLNLHLLLCTAKVNLDADIIKIDSIIRTII